MASENTQMDSFSSPVQPPVSSTVPAVIALLNEWLRDETGYDEQTWPELKVAIDRDRSSSRRLFDA